MEVIETSIPEIKILKPKRFHDERGFFVEVYNKRTFLEVGIDCDFVQDNESFSKKKGTIRGLHFQISPFIQDKLIRVVKGSVFDVVVDLRRGSPTFGRFVSVQLDSLEGKQLYVPGGFAHGFCTLEDNTEVVYKVNHYYAPDFERGVLWDDPELAIPWPFKKDQIFVYGKDQKWPLFSDIPEFFKYEGSKK